jgi:isopentenyl-diphosphate Delta-isomerase
MEQVVLVDTEDIEIGVMEKLEAHQTGQLHRALSVLVFNSKGEMLLQKRASNKYHSGGLWTNACCSHPRPNEKVAYAAKRRLKEEIGLDGTPTFFYKFIYKVDLDHGMTEHEFDHVFTCTTDQLPILNEKEAEAYKYIKMSTLANDINQHPESYTFWFKIIIDRIKDQL